jgi:iron complex outermembrane recepter protein
MPRHWIAEVGVRATVSLLALAAAGALQTPAFAQATDTRVEEVVVTAAPYVVSTDSLTSNVDVVRREELDLAPPGGVGDVLSELPGVRSTFFGPGASRPVIRGLAGPRVLVLTNGLGQIDASSLSPDHQVASDPSEAERIEVLRGPAALAYGGSAIGGIVNVIDNRIASRRPEGAIDGRLAAYGTTVDDGYNFAGSLKAALGSNLVVTFDGVRRETHDYDIPVPAESDTLRRAEGEELEPDEASTVENSALELNTYGVGLAYLAQWGFVGMSVKQVDTRYGIPGLAHAHGHEEEEHEDEEHGEGEHEEGEEGVPVTIDLQQTRYDVRGEINRGFGPFERVRFAAGYATYEHVELEGEEVGTRFLSDGIEGRLELVHRSHDGHDGAIGVQALRRNLDAIGAEAYVPATEISELGAFTLQRWDLDRWGFEGGLRLDTRRLESLAGGRDFTNISASIGAFVRPAEGWFLGASLSRTSRAPTESELFADGPHIATRGYEIGDPELDSEVSYSFDGTIHYGGGRVDMDLHLFAVRYDGFIDLRPTGQEEDELAVFAYRQTGADFYGFEAEVGVRVLESAQGSLTLEGAADFVRGATDLGPPARVPPWSLTGRAVWKADRYELRGEVRRVAEQDRVAEFELPTDGYTLINVAAVIRPFEDRRTRLFADVRNLTNAEAREHASFLKDFAPMPGRNVRLGVSYEF